MKTRIFTELLMMKMSPTTLTSRQQVEHLLYSAASNQRGTAGKQESNSLETILDALRTIVKEDGGDLKATAIDPKSGGFADITNRNSFHDNMVALAVYSKHHPGLTITPIFKIPSSQWHPAQGIQERDEEIFSPNPGFNKYQIADGRVVQIAEAAKEMENVAFRYALVHLNPFVVEGVAGLYDKFNDSESLDAYSPEFVSDQYYTDRAEFLVNLLQNNPNNSKLGSYNPAAPHNYYYDVDVEGDKQTGKKHYFSFLDGTEVPLSEYNHRAFGTLEGDTIEGADKDDHLYGMSGNDTIRVHSLTSANSIEHINGGAGENIIAGTGMADTINLTGIDVKNIKEIRGGGGNQKPENGSRKPEHLDTYPIPSEIIDSFQPVHVLV